VNFYSFDDVSGESYARLNAMIETMNEQHEHVISEMMAFGLLNETDPSIPSPRFDASLYNDCESFLPLESNIIDDTTLTDLEEAFDLSLTSLPFVAPFFSSTPMDTSVSDLILLASPLYLAQCMGLEIGKISKVMLML